MDNEHTLHIRCGRDIEPTLRAAGFVGHFHEFSDPFCQGPLDRVPTDEFLHLRACFIAAAYDLKEKSVRWRQNREYIALERLAAYERIVLWFEHDHFDQLILAYLLMRFAEMPDLPPVDLICVDDYPVLPRFVGLGQLGPDDLKSLWPNRVAVGQAHFDLGRTAWAALTDENPKALFALMEAGTPAVPPMAGALDRYLWELPSSRHGLSLTETLSLRILAENGRQTCKQMFDALMLRYEPLPHLGDIMYYYTLDRLARGGAITVVHHTGVAAETVMELSLLGERILMTEEDWLDHLTWPRQMGGWTITPRQANWRRNAKGDLVFA